MSDRSTAVLTDLEQLLLDFIVSYTSENGWPPSVRECGEHCGWASTSTTHRHLASLVDKGAIVRGGAGSPRAIRVVVS